MEGFPFKKNEVAKHSVFSASSSSIWLACSGSTSMSEGVEDHSSPSSLLGTAAHSLGEICLKLGLTAYDYVGLTVSGHVVTHEMADAVQLYVGKVREICRKYNVEPMLEKRVVMSSVNENVYGTSDCIFIIGDILIVIDYKHGYGVVEAKGNTQGIFYGVATLDTYRLWETVKRVVICIVQPRADHVEGPIREEVYNIGFMRSYQKIFEKAVNKPFELNAGPHCKWCKARHHCQARRERTYDLASLSKPLDKMSPAEIFAVYDEIDAMRSHLKAIEVKTLDLVKSGVNLKGHKLVRSIVRASCADEEGFIKEAEKRGVSTERLFNKKLKSMTHMKKILPPEMVNEYFVKPPSSITLVKLSDKRPAVSVGESKPPSATGRFGSL